METPWGPLWLGYDTATACLYEYGDTRELLGTFNLDSIKTAPFDDHIGSYPVVHSCGIYIIIPIGVHHPRSNPYACWLPICSPILFPSQNHDVKAGQASI